LRHELGRRRRGALFEKLAEIGRDEAAYYQYLAASNLEEIGKAAA